MVQNFDEWSTSDFDEENFVECSLPVKQFNIFLLLCALAASSVMSTSYFVMTFSLTSTDIATCIWLLCLSRELKA